ncbi:type III pantothenate kinase [Oceanibacterium hippocampi]|uniref:Type III pantothenate kinase n=1 Tax=Oceanibacterium hippocampi TaxID=745714 RepID=A0A1Y5T1D8_9PROT|nr:type III pantothenate kinase [Oceanibacterium hippocampi]SLN53677.1 Type III pantothenate kinase [Oceanibacterium hippocampi]
MLLAIDVGNTNTTFAIYDGETMRGEWRIATSDKRTADEYAAWLLSLMQLSRLSFDDIEAAIIASVVPQSDFNMKTLCRRYFEVDPRFIGDENVTTGIRARIDNPREVGADRIVDAVGAHVKYGGPLIIIDFGTATTFDVIDENGDFCGGVFAPGINLSLQALHMAAAKLPRVAVARPERVIGRNTQECMQSGVFWGYVSMIEGIVTRIREEWGVHMGTVATGGLAPLFAEGTNAIDRIDQDLTMNGLLEIHRRNSNLQ